MHGGVLLGAIDEGVVPAAVFCGTLVRVPADGLVELPAEALGCAACCGPQAVSQVHAIARMAINRIAFGIRSQRHTARVTPARAKRRALLTITELTP